MLSELVYEDAHCWVYNSETIVIAYRKVSLSKSHEHHVIQKVTSFDVSTDQFQAGAVK